MKNLHTVSHPSLIRIYGQAPEEAQVLFLDESYSTAQEGLKESFYLLTAVQFAVDDLPVLRDDLVDLAGGTYWHTTEALQSPHGTQKFEAFLDYFSCQKDPSFITCKVELPEGYSTEKARRRCLEKLLVEGASRVPNLQGVIFEQRNVARDNNRDRAYLKKLEGQGLIPAGLKRAWVSPRDEIALWAPDIIGMAYRRTRTHQDATSRLFDSYLSSTARVFEI